VLARRSSPPLASRTMHASAHRLVHHVHCATKMIRTQPRVDKAFAVSAIPAWIGSFLGIAVRNARAPGLPRADPPILPAYIFGAMVFRLPLCAVGTPWWRAALRLAMHATAQLLTADYVQHNGLTRHRLSNGTVRVPVRPEHAGMPPTLERGGYAGGASACPSPHKPGLGFRRARPR
jgi:alkane 1-monooxygenase